MARILWLLLIWNWGGCHGFQWTGGPEDNAVLYLCATENLTLPWDYVLSPGETVFSVEWYFHGRSEELIAILMHGHFLPEVGYLTRVNLVPNAGIVINNVISGETGNYSVVISGHDSSGISFTYRRSVVVQISAIGHLMTSDDQLHATVKAEAIYSNDTGIWSLELSCGNFTFLGDPPFDLEWVTPSGAVVNSTEYKYGEFHLHVKTGGDFVCRVPDQAAIDNCMPQPPPNASIHLDPVETRLTLMEHRQYQLQDENERLKNQLEQSVQTLQSKESQLEQSVQTLQSKDSQLDQSVQTLQSKESQLDQSIQQLQSKDVQLQNSIQHLSDMSTSVHPVAFYAWLTINVSSFSFHPVNIHFDHVETNIGNAYSSTGVFTPPRAGLYYFALTLDPVDNSHYSHGYVIKQSGANICTIVSHVSGDLASCHAAVHLSAGEYVHVQSHGLFNVFGGQQTSFSGFLLAPDA